VAEPKLTPEMLPEKLGDFVFDEAERMGADPAGLALSVIVVASAAISNTSA